MDRFLLPYRYKLAGFVLIILGLGELGYYILFDFRLMMPVFAVISSFLQTRFFITFRTNIADELIMLTLLTGFVLATFSKDRVETEGKNTLRAEALFKALLANACFLVFSILFFYGNGFLFALLLNLVSVFIFYHLFFEILKRRKR